MPARPPAGRPARCSLPRRRHRGHDRRCAVPGRALDAGRQLYLRDRRRQRHLSGRPAAGRDLFRHHRLGAARVRHVARGPGAGGAAEHRHLRPGRRQRRLHHHPAGDGERRLAVDPGRTRQLLARQRPERQAQRLRSLYHRCRTTAFANPGHLSSQRQPERRQQRQHSLHLHRDAKRQHDGRIDRQLRRDGQRRQPGDGRRLHGWRLSDRDGELRCGRDRQDDHRQRGR